jgi:hypothetical protein
MNQVFLVVTPMGVVICHGGTLEKKEELIEKTK